MPIIRRLVAQDNNEENQWLKVDHSSRYIENDGDDWQFLFGPNSELSNSDQIIKVTARFDDSTFDNIKIIAYLYERGNAAVANASTCQFKIHKISGTNWDETILTTLNGSQLSNNYFYINPTLSTLAPVDFRGGESLMIEATIVRLGVTYRDRIYVNHLGIYDNVVRLKNQVQFLDITKQDI